MKNAPNHPQESDRLASLRAHHILDTDPDGAFDDLTALTAEMCDVPIALISLVDESRQWFKSRVGLDTTETPRDISFCGHAICADETLVVEDALEDERFHDNPFVVDGLNLRFYAGAKVVDANGLPLGTLCLIDDKPRRFDAQQQKQLERMASQVSRQLAMHKLLSEISDASHRDELTGLLNRRGLTDTLKQLCVAPDQYQALIYLELDRFKPINDSFGHAAGDQVLKNTAARLELAVHQLLSPQDADQAAIARLASDDFAISICTDRDPRWIEELVIASLNEAIEEPSRWGEEEFVVSATMGLVCTEPGEVMGIEEALSNADIAMCEAKNVGTQFIRFDSSMRERVCQEILIEDRLRKAVEQGHITAVFEPIMDLETGRVLGFESLARWTDPQLGVIPPFHFIPIAERTGLIDRVFDAIARQALATYKQVADQISYNLWFSVNLSKAQLNDDRLFDQLDRIMKETGVEPKHLHLEVTESLVASSNGMIPKLHRLNELGHPLMLDDFGSGTSSLSCLKEYPVQWIKIDRELTSAAPTGRAYSAILHAVSDLSSNLGLSLIAEGVEDEDTISLLQGMEVHAAQGWYWSKPIAREDVADWLLCNADCESRRPRVA